MSECSSVEQGRVGVVCATWIKVGVMCGTEVRVGMACSCKRRGSMASQVDSGVGVAGGEKLGVVTGGIVAHTQGWE